MNLREALKNKKTRIRLCYHRFDLFLLWYLRESFPVPFSPKHKELIQLLQDGKFEEFVVIAHRNFGKTLIVKGYILWLLCYNRVKFVIIAAHEGTKSKGHAFDIGLQLQVNKRIINDFGNLYWEDKEKDGLKKKLRKKEDWFLTTHGAMVKATQASIRGETFTDTTGTYRPDLVYYDDIENLNTVKSYAVTQKLIDNLGESKNAKAIGGRSIFAVNRLSTQGAVAFLEGRTDGEKIKKFEAKLIDAPLVQDKLNIVESAKKNIQWKTRYVATDKQKKILNELADTKTKVESVETLLKDGLSVFMREYQNEPQEAMEQFVKQEYIKNHYYTVADFSKVCIAIDPQSGMTTKSDEYAITVVGYNHHDSNRYVIEQTAGRASPSAQAEQFIQLMIKYYDKLELAGIEVIKTQTAVYLTVLDWISGKITIGSLPKCDKEYPVVKTNTKDNKETRLNRFVPAFERGEIHLKPDMLELEEQLIYFTNLPHDDRCISGEAVIPTARGDIKMKDIKVGDYVLTPVGFKKVTAWKNKGKQKVINFNGLICTPDHPVFSYQKGFARADTIVYTYDICKLSITKIIKSKFLEIYISMVENIHCYRKEGITYLLQHEMQNEKVLKVFMLQFGSFIINKQYRKAMLSIIKTVIGITTILTTWSVYLVRNTLKNTLKKSHLSCLSIWKLLGSRLKNGTLPLKALSGTDKTVKKLGLIEKNILICVRLVAKVMKHISLTGQKLAVLNASKDCNQKKLLQNNANIANKTIKQINTVQQKPAQEVVQTVYDITVEQVNCFYADNILVGNCDSLIMALELIQRTKGSIYKGVKKVDNIIEQDDFDDFDYYQGKGTVMGDILNERF